VRFRDQESSRGSQREEIEANQFAAEILMPEQIVRAWAERINFDLADDSDDERAMSAMENLAKRFQVSVQALSFRIANLAALDLA
jgi:Zn-dependent peptidase ImmA (M78 family)